MAFIGVASAAVERREASPLRISLISEGDTEGAPHPLVRSLSTRLSALRLPSFVGEAQGMALVRQNSDAGASRERVDVSLVLQQDINDPTGTTFWLVGHARERDFLWREWRVRGWSAGIGTASRSDWP